MNPINHPIRSQERATVDPPAKRHSNGLLLVGRWWPDTVCWLGIVFYSRTWFIMLLHFLYRLPCLTLELRLSDSAMSISICLGKIKLRCSAREYRAI